MNVAEFIAKWKKVELKERSAAQEHFIDLCRILGHPTPAEADPTGESFCFEKGAAKEGGGDGFADVWKKDFFGWEYKGKDKDLDAAYRQLLLYRDDLANPPLLVVCDLARIIVHTNFTGTVSVAYEISLDQLGEARSLEILRAVFSDPEKLRPGRTSAAVTQDAAERFAQIADSMRQRGLDSGRVAHFLNRIVFCLFAEDIDLLPDMIFTHITEKAGGDPVRFSKLIGQLFEAMAKGGDFGLETIRHFNGNLFDDATVLEMTPDEVTRVAELSRMDWSAVDPSIFGTLFERGLDPDKRSQLGAHYTSREDIETLVEPVVMQPLRREWAETRTVIESLLATGKKNPAEAKIDAPPLKPAQLKKARAEGDSILHQFLVRLQGVKVLDPACGSGNFLYVTLQKLKDMEKEAILYGMAKGFGGYLPAVGPWQLYGIEINRYAYDLAQTSIWIGFLQWTRANGFQITQQPILRTMQENFHCMDAILDLSNPADPKEPEWPKVDFIIGNPPFLGGSKLWEELGRDYQERLWQFYKDRVPGAADLCCYWFEKARTQIAAGKCKRAGLLATQGIRGGANREVLVRIKDDGGIFWAESDRPWVLDGANVHVSMVAFDDGTETNHILDGDSVLMINANLTASTDTTAARAIPGMLGMSFIGTKKAGKFELLDSDAIPLLNIPNPHGRPNSDVIRPWLDGFAVTRRPSHEWIIDCGTDMEETAFLRYAEPYARVLALVRPDREKNKRDLYRNKWWLHAETRPGMRRNCLSLPRYLATVCHSKYRLFVWADNIWLPDGGVFTFARSDNYFFGVLHSRLHEVWALKMGTRLETRPRYTPTTCFETFPLPTPTADQEKAIAEEAKELNELRERWLNPPEWTKEEVLEFPGTVGGPWDRFIARDTIEDRGSFKVGTVRYPRLVARDTDCAKQLAKRTLTNLYNQRPAWLDTAHRKLDAVVSAAYGWPPDLTDEQILEKLLALNLARAQRESAKRTKG